MLSGILNSDKAINMNIAIMRAFVEIRRLALKQNDAKEQLDEIRQRIGEHDMQLSSIYDAIENLLDEKAAQRKWDENKGSDLKNKKQSIYKITQKSDRYYFEPLFVIVSI